jgi:hypothetical protein
MVLQTPCGDFNIDCVFLVEIFFNSIALYRYSIFENALLEIRELFILNI